MKRILFLIVFSCAVGHAQNPGAMAAQQAQQAMDAAQQANQQAMQAAQQANEQAIQAAQQANQQAMQNAQNNNEPVVAYTQPPTFSVRAGAVAVGTTVRLKSRTHYAVIYYTTNGWTPTTNSRRYQGPIPVRDGMVLQAIAVSPNALRSPIASAKYSVPSAPKTTKDHSALSIDGVLRAGTHLHLVTKSTINSKTAQVGDSLDLLLDQDVKVGDIVVLPKGTPVRATITQAAPAGHAGTPGDVTFEVHSLAGLGKEIALKGGESLEGANHYTRAKSFLIVPVVGLAGLAARGEEAEIKPGMRLTASVAEDTPLQP